MRKEWRTILDRQAIGTPGLLGLWPLSTLLEGARHCWVAGVEGQQASSPAGSRGAQEGPLTCEDARRLRAIAWPPGWRVCPAGGRAHLPQGAL